VLGIPPSEIIVRMESRMPKHRAARSKEPVR
jgi:hypothetical protein